MKDLQEITDTFNQVMADIQPNIQPKFYQTFNLTFYQTFNLTFYQTFNRNSTKIQPDILPNILPNIQPKFNPKKVRKSWYLLISIVIYY